MDLSPTQPLTLQIEPTDQPGVEVIKIKGPVTIHNFSRLQDLAQRKDQPQLLFLDLSEVPYIDSAALGSFVAIHVACEASGRRYALVGANERLRNLFDLAYVRAFLVVFDSLADAQAKLKPA